ncbi:MAG: hypothetical protein M1835_003092, partial [Candelina submexicana]
MAANDYYNPTLSHTNDPHHQMNAPLPPLPSPSPPSHVTKPTGTATPVSPVVSPFDDHVYNTYPPPNHKPSFSSDSAYHGAAGTTHGQDPFADDIPLKPRPHMSTSDEWNRRNRNQHQYPPSPESQLPPHENGFGKPKKKRMGGGFFKGKIPWVVYGLTIIHLSVFIAEIIKNSVLTGSPIQIHPQFNPMIGPSYYVLINMGARYVPCMRSTEGVQDSSIPIGWPCPNSTSSDINSPMNKCQLGDLCGFQSNFPNPVANGKLSDNPQPNQWYRFIIPMFLHAGIIHIAFNLLLQLTLGADMERQIGPLRFALVYFSAGIFGFVLGGNFAASGISSTGASGCLFGILALELLRLLYTWKERPKPWRDLAFIVLDIVISFALGLLPGLDNFSHIGGFLMGLVLGICLLHSPNSLRERIGDAPPYAPVSSANRTGEADGGIKGFAKQPVGFFKGRKPLWWAWWLLRAGAL